MTQTKMTLNIDEAIVDQVYDIDEDKSIKKGNILINIGPEVNIESIEKIENKIKNKVRFYNITEQIVNNIF